jgi:hypothetical protein
MVFYHTFNFNHVLLKFILLVVQGCIDPSYSYAHVIHCFFLLNIVDSSDFVTSMGAIYVYMISFTTPTFHRCLSWNLYTYFFLSGLSKILLSLRTVSEKGRFVSLLRFLFLEILLVIQSLPKSGLFSLFIIYAFFSSYCLFHSFRIIILDLVTDGRW